MGLFNELKRRNVFKVGGAYLVLTWIVIQVVQAAVPALHLPEWVNSLVFLFAAIGFPFALFFAWAFELTPDGIKRDSEVSRDNSITSHTGRKIDFTIIGLLVIALAYFIWASYSDKPEVSPIAELQTDHLSNNKSIAVLPFTNMAADDKNESFTLGIHDDLLTHLSKISALKVISRTSVLRYKDTEKPIAEIANELGVKNILEGSVQSSGQQIRINVQLIDAKTDDHLWAEIYDRKLTTENIFNIQTEISKEIAAALKAQLTPAEQQSIAKQATDNLDAYNAYLAGRQRQLNRNSKDLKQALALFERATELDPNFALAYVGQADTLFLLQGYSDLSTKEMKARTGPLIAKALQLEPLLAEAHTSKASSLMDDGKYKEAEKIYQYSLSLNPNYATTHHWYGLMLRNTGRYEEALDSLRKAIALDPTAPVILSTVAGVLSRLGRYSEAKTQYQRLIELVPNYSNARAGFADLYDTLGEFDKAVISRLEAIGLDKGNVGIKQELGNTYLHLGDLENAKVVLAQMRTQFQQNSRIINLQNFIWIAEGKVDKWFDFAEQRYQQDNENINAQYDYAYANLFTSRVQAANDVLLIILKDKESGQIDVTRRNLETVIDLAWTFRHLEQESKAQQLLSEAKQLIDSSGKHNIRWHLFAYEAVQGNPKAAASAYAAVIENGSYEYWWVNKALPYVTEVKKEPQYIEAHKQLMNKLKQQRQQLVEYVRLEETD